MLCCRRAPWAGQGNALGASQPPPPPLGVDQLLGSGFDSFIIFIFNQRNRIFLTHHKIVMSWGSLAWGAHG